MYLSLSMYLSNYLTFYLSIIYLFLGGSFCHWRSEMSRGVVLVKSATITSQRATWSVARSPTRRIVQNLRLKNMILHKLRSDKQCRFCRILNLAFPDPPSRKPENGWWRWSLRRWSPWRRKTCNDVIMTQTSFPHAINGKSTRTCSMYLDKPQRTWA